MCKINSLRLTSESKREQSQIIYSVCLCCFVFKEFPMNGNYWQTGGVEVAFSFGLFGRFPNYLPLGQQYLPLNRKPRIWLAVVDYPRARGRVADAGLNARGLSERDCHLGILKCACVSHSDCVCVRRVNIACACICVCVAGVNHSTTLPPIGNENDNDTKYYSF